MKLNRTLVLLHLQFDCFTFSGDKNSFCEDERAIVTFLQTQKLFKYTWHSKDSFTLSVCVNARMLLVICDIALITLLKFLNKPKY